MPKVITMTDSNYFQFGSMFLQTRKNVNAEFICYAPDLTDNQQAILREHNIEYRKISASYFNKRMQFLKFFFLYFVSNECKKNELITYCDWDTFFCRDWQSKIDTDISLGITYRNDMIKTNCFRAYTNGGVIFARAGSGLKGLCRFAIKTILAGGDEELPEYDLVWKTLETGRKPAKTHYRTTLRWWVDQVFLSACYVAIDFTDKYKIGFYDCDIFNRIDATRPGEGFYIGHLKTKSGASGKVKDGV